ncbi:uncharacterized protein M6B38_151215 [Iris pallida]|uniref:Uncharacterized protein n=1 Tax=Iris pallida TaxID=29817 RepID=A0AAX6F6U5_IRIPA|nr:uncharacterized protein M6B38_151215 [Iris pallida]
MDLIDFFEFDDGRDGSNDGHFREEEKEEESCCDDFSVAESMAFWRSQHDLLREALSRSHTIERRVRIDVEQILSRIRSGGRTICDCPDEACRGHCVLRCVDGRLRDAGYDSALCKSKWKRSPDIYSGEHCFIDVIAAAKKKGKEEAMRVVIEVNFRTEFEMARASAEYRRLVSGLPEVFVGRAGRLRGVIGVVCEAAKRSARENGMHMAPWRRHKYVQAKWLGTCERMAPSPVVFAAAAAADRPAKPTASMLTSALRCTATKVVDMEPVPVLTLF